MYGLSDSEEVPQTRKSRVQQACTLCRSRKQKCDGLKPCTACHASDRPCDYENIPPTKEERGLKKIASIATETLDEVRTLARQLKEPSRSLGGLLTTGTLHLRSLEISPETHTTLFSSEKLRELFEAYIRHAHVLHPIFDAPWKMCKDFIREYSDTAAERRDSITPCLQNAKVLLFLALGSCGSIQDRSCRPSILPGMPYYYYAQSILERERGASSVALAQTMTLAALYTNQFGMFHESWKNIHFAYRIFMHLRYYEQVPANGPAVQDESPQIPEEAKRSSWICRSLARGIEDCLGLVSSGLDSITGSDVLSAESLQEGPETAYAMRVQVRKIFEKAQKLTTVEAPATWQVEIPKNWKPVLPSWLAWEDEEPPSTDPLKASLRAEYYSGTVKSLWPHLEIVLGHKCFPLTMDKLSADQRELAEVVRLWVKAALASISAFDRVGAVADSAFKAYQRPSNSPVLLSNPVKTLHGEFKTVLLLWAIRYSAIYPLLDGRMQLTETTLDAVHLRTVDRLSGFWPSSPLLSQDLEWLRALGCKEESINPLNLARMLLSANNPSQEHIW